MTSSSEDSIIYAAFFFVDIVGLSDPAMSTNTQIRKIKALNKGIFECLAFKSTPKEELLILPTGDGMAIGFLKGLDKPLNLARELHLKLNQYNDDKNPIDVVKVRIGCHDGHVFVVHDIYGNQNIWGPGIILTRRVMDLADAGHILMTANMAESLIELSDEYRRIIHPVHDFQIKHGQNILVYSVHGEGFGNPSRPTKALIAGSKIAGKVKETQKNLSIKSVEFDLSLKDYKAGLLSHKRTYRIINNSKEPVFMIYETINDVEMPISEINLQVFDENNELKIQEIVSDTPERKEIIVKLHSPVFRGEAARPYSVMYETIEQARKHNILFLGNANNLVVSFSYPETDKDEIKPVLYLVNQGKRTAVSMDSMMTANSRVVARWRKEDKNFVIQKNDIVSLEW
jgi:hypothetical protein